MRERAKGAMRRGMAIAADDRRARQRKTLFGADHMNDALAKVVLIEIFDAELPGILGELFDLNTAFGIVDAMRAIGGGDIVIDDRERFLRRTNAPAAQPQPLEGLRARHLMHQMAVDVDQARAIGFGMDEMIVPDFIIEGARLRHRAIPCRWLRLLQKYHLEWQFLLARSSGGSTLAILNDSDARRNPCARLARLLRPI